MSASHVPSTNGESKGRRPEGTELKVLSELSIGKSVYFTRKGSQSNFDVNQYTVRKGGGEWKGLRENLDKLDQHRRELDHAQESPKKAATKFGTWDGVFVACLLNIFGVIMFLRLPWAVAQAGIIQCVLIVLVANVVTALTTMSMSAIATNGEVRAGGAYYLISRSLGHRMGGPIGILFSFGQAIATALYVIGFCETLVLQLGDSQSVTGNQLNDIRIYGLAVITIILILAYIGLDWVVKLQVFLLVLMTGSILCIMIGTFIVTNEDKAIVGYKSSTASDNAGPEYRNGYDFFGVFGVFFPAVTGIMAGANKSGDLEDPSVNIPVGTIWSVIVSMIVYIILTIMIGATVERRPEGSDEGLYEDILILVELAVPYIGGPFVLAGIYAATFSSGLASIVGAPRILMAVAQDDLIPLVKPFAVVRSSDQEPVRGYFLTYVISVACILVGDLNAIAPLISMFFMITYGLVNLACFMLAFSKSPSWRPTFKYYSKWGSFAGFLICLVIMFLTSWYIALAAIVIAASLYYYIDWRDPPVNWGSANQARQFYDVEKSMMRMRHFQTHVKTFRPHYLVMTGDPTNRLDLCRFVGTLKKGYGITIFGNVYLGKYSAVAKDFRRRKYDQGYFADRSTKGIKVKGFMSTTIAATVREGCRNLICCGGLGVMRPNTLVLGFKKNWKESLNSTVSDGATRSSRALSKRTNRADSDGKEGIANKNFFKPRSQGLDSDDESTVKDYVGMIFDGFKMGMGVMVCRNMDKVDWYSEPKSGAKETVDVWWLVDDGGLCCLIPYILSLNTWWKSRTGKGQNLTHVRVLLVLKKEEDVAQLATIKELLKMFRIPWENDIKACIMDEGVSGDMLENYKTYTKRESVHKEAQEKNVHWLKVSSLIKKESKDAAMVFVTLPYPLPGIEDSLYMSWLDHLSEDKPTVLLRGNNENVLTFYLE